MEIAENKLLEKLARFGKTRGARPGGAPVCGSQPDVVRGIGDDGAVVRMSDGSHVLVQDVLVEHIHFDLAFQKAFDVGKKAVYINVSDVLAMGARPLYFLVTLGLPQHIRASQVEELYRGMSHAGREFGVALIGGDTSETRSDFFVDVSMTGRLVVPDYLGRNKARVGDLIGVTGFLGEAAYGLHLLKEGKMARMNRFTRRYASPRPPVETWQALVDMDVPHAMMDISDGLLIDLERMMGESRKAAVVHLEQIPIPDRIIKEGKELFALAGGEDYQFLFTFGKDRLQQVESLNERKLQVSVIGEVRMGKGVRLYDKGREKKVVMKGYEHFRTPRESGWGSARVPGKNR